MDLAERLTQIGSTLTEAERDSFKLLLGMAAGGLVGEDGEPPEEGLHAVAFDTTLRCISNLQPHYRQVPSNGVVYRGRPDFLTDELLDALRAEATQVRPQAERFDDHYVTSGAPLASEIAVSSELYDVLSAHAGHIQATARANYLYYDEPGLGIDPHVDKDTFSLNTILMLRHDYDSQPSALVLYPAGREPERIYLQPGEMISMYADSIAHARERVREGESIGIVAFGFRFVA